MLFKRIEGTINNDPKWKYHVSLDVRSSKQREKKETSCCNNNWALLTFQGQRWTRTFFLYHVWSYHLKLVLGRAILRWAMERNIFVVESISPSILYFNLFSTATSQCHILTIHNLEWGADFFLNCEEQFDVIEHSSVHYKAMLMQGLPFFLQCRFKFFILDILVSNSSI